MSRPEPHVLAQLDQNLAALDGHLDLVVQMLARLAALRGEAQATADACAFLETWPHIDVCALLAVAAQRLAKAGES